MAENVTDTSNEYNDRLRKLNDLQEAGSIVYKDKFERTHTCIDSKKNRRKRRC